MYTAASLASTTLHGAGTDPAGSRNGVSYRLVLGGGAHLGAVQAGQLLALAEAGISVSSMYGCSVGALNGAWMSNGFTVANASKLVESWQAAEHDQLFDTGWRRLYAIVRSERSLSRGDAIRTVVEDACPHPLLEQFEIPLEVVTCNLTAGRVEYHRTGPAVERVLASCSMPGLLPPVEIDGDRHVDGGVLDVLPWRRAITSGDPVLVLDCRSGKHWEPGDRYNALHILLDSFALARHHRVYDGIEAVAHLAVVPGADVGRGHTLRDATALIEASAARCREWVAGGGLDRLAATVAESAEQVTAPRRRRWVPWRAAARA